MTDQLRAYTKKSADLFSACEWFDYSQRTGAQQWTGEMQRQASEVSMQAAIHHGSHQASMLREYYRHNPPGSDEEKAMVRLLLDGQVDMTPETASALRQAQARANLLWESQASEDEYLDALDEMFCIYRSIIDLASYRHPLDYFIAKFEHGFTVQRLDALFEPVKKSCIDIVRHGRAVSPSYPEIPKRIAEGLFGELIVCMRVGIGIGDIRDAHLAFCNLCGNRDVKLAIDKTHFARGYTGLMHELGHALYVMRTDERLENNGLWLPTSRAMDEAAAILYEHEIGKSRAFLHHVTRRIRDLGGTGVDAGQLYDSFNRLNLRPRVDADPVTYALCIIIRYEIEKDLLEGRISVKDLPEAWRDRHREYLGIETGSGREGIMQEVHWTTGLIGYFPVYLLGRMIAHALYERMMAVMPDLEQDIENGRLDRVHDFMTDRIFRHGSMYTAEELLAPVIGNEPVRQYVAYLKQLNESG